MAAEKQCSKCGAMNPVTDRFCGSCGTPLESVEKVSAGEDGLYYCYRHKKETTRLTCGRCERPICTKCMVMSPAGVRCRDCARSRTPIRVGGVLHDVGSGVRRGVGGRNPIWYLWLFQIIASFFRGFFR